MLEVENAVSDFSANGGLGVTRMLPSHIVAHRPPTRRSLPVYVGEDVAADRENFLANLVPVDDTDQVGAASGFMSKDGLPDPAAFRRVMPCPRRTRSTPWHTKCCLARLRCAIPGAGFRGPRCGRGCRVVLLEVPRFGQDRRRQRGALGVPDVILAVARHTLVATPIVAVSPVVDVVGVGLQQVVRREQHATESAVEGLLVKLRSPVVRDATKVVGDAVDMFGLLLVDSTHQGQRSR